MTDTVRVPREPTEAMLQGACDKHKPGQPMSEDRPEECPRFQTRRRIYAAMLAASPQGEGSSASADTQLGSADRWSDLDRLARAATPGKWVAAAKPSSVVGWPIVSTPSGRCICDVTYMARRPDDDETWLDTQVNRQSAGNAAFIAAADPATVLELIAAARSVGMSEANAPYRVTEGVKP